MPQFNKAEANRILGRLVAVWSTPGTGIRQIEDLLDDLVRRVEVMKVAPNTFEPRPIRTAEGKMVDPRPIMNLRQQGLTYREISEQLGIPMSTIYKIYKNRHRYGVLAEHSYVMTKEAKEIEDVDELEVKKEGLR